MGITRKALSVMTVGAIDFRSDKERTAAYTRATRDQARKQTKIMQRESRSRGRRERAEFNAWARQENEQWIDSLNAAPLTTWHGGRWWTWDEQAQHWV